MGDLISIGGKGSIAVVVAALWFGGCTTVSAGSRASNADCSFSFELPMGIAPDQVEQTKAGGHWRLNWLLGDGDGQPVFGQFFANCSGVGQLESVKKIDDRIEECRAVAELIASGDYTEKSSCDFGFSQGYYWKHEVQDPSRANAANVLVAIGKQDTLLVGFFSDREKVSDTKKVVRKLLKTIQTTAPLDVTNYKNKN